MAFRLATAQSVSDEDGTFIWNECFCRGSKLHVAVLRGSLQRVKELLQNKPDKLALVQSRFSFTECGKEGEAEAIHIGASRGHVEVVQYLLECQAQPSAMVSLEGQPQYDVLHAAVLGEGRGGCLGMIKYLFSVKAPVTKDSEGRSLKHIAFKTGSVEIIEYLRMLEGGVQKCGSFHESSLRPTPNLDQKTGVPDPLILGVHGGQMSEEVLSKVAEPDSNSLKIFISECPQCIPLFLERISSENVSVAASDLAKFLTSFDIAKVLRESPEAALALLDHASEEPLCNSGWHPLPTRVSFANRNFVGHIRSMFNPPRAFMTFYVDESTWLFNSSTFKPPDWHNNLTNRAYGRPVLDAEVKVCMVPDILCAEVFSAMVTSENSENAAVAEDDIISAAVNHVFWSGCCRVDLTTVLLNFWGLGLLIAEEALMWEGDEDETTMFRMGKGRRLDRNLMGVAGMGMRTDHRLGIWGAIFGGEEDTSLPAWMAISWIGAKGLIDLWQEWLQFRGFWKIGRTSEYFAVDNLLDMIFSCLPMFLFFNPNNLVVLVLAVFLYWGRLLDCFTSAEYVGLEILPIRKMAMGLLPALVVTLVAFCAFTHAFYLVDGGAAVPRVMDVVFETFATLMTAALPPDISESQSKNQVKLILCLGAVSFFTVFILNIFIGVMGELYVKEKERAENTFKMYRAGSCYQYLLRCRVLPCNLMTGAQGLYLMAFAGSLALGLQIYGMIYHQTNIPGASLVFFVCQALIMLGAYQSQEPWAKGSNAPQGYHLWYCKAAQQEEVAKLVEDVKGTLEHMEGVRDEMKALKGG
mmetsp:Transcript_98926/g.236025  ORF Transcript_98926/g.236025 Transcript_98926/m.236025 type:complete len:806 (-) Transcript_98926:52-2469(-)|eukprot:CAMPEP_0181434154 /NCGR_PEP_ID=MMETSP1110-20121109/19672_1 /TAXON_ID=174948 /ORGANISM="Symbiodinium sp., Strain CCMP421" /LENGTH=805 /DNA_ID=CAMNT_0023557651 /DNA_START=71 /DNA_END=2488 /DNA_ORIENTATION=-